MASRREKTRHLTNYLCLSQGQFVSGGRCVVYVKQKASPATIAKRQTSTTKIGFPPPSRIWIWIRQEFAVSSPGWKEEEKKNRLKELPTKYCQGSAWHQQMERKTARARVWKIHFIILLLRIACSLFFPIRKTSALTCRATRGEQYGSNFWGQWRTHKLGSKENTIAIYFTM